MMSQVPIRIAFIMTDGIEQIELTSPWDALKATTAELQLLSDHTGHIQGYIDDVHPGETFPVDATIESASASDYDGVVVPGGVVNADAFRTNKHAQAFVRDAMSEGKFVATICHGAWLLVEAGLVKGREITSYPSIKTDLVNAGAIWIDQEVVIDSDLISSRSPDDLAAFNREIVRRVTALAPKH